MLKTVRSHDHGLTGPTVRTRLIPVMQRANVRTRRHIVPKLRTVPNKVEIKGTFDESLNVRRFRYARGSVK